jgi:hypothetical protein
LFYFCRLVEEAQIIEDEPIDELPPVEDNLENQ